MKEKHFDTEQYDEVISKKQNEAKSPHQGELAESDYQYFDFSAIRNSMGILAKDRTKGKQIIKAGNLHLTGAKKMYLDGGEGVCCRFMATGVEERYHGRYEVRVTVLIDSKRVLTSSCNCFDCQVNHYWEHKSKCAYVSATLDLAAEFEQCHHIMDATNYNAMKMLNNFARRKQSLALTEIRQQDQTLRLEPRLVCKDENILLSFKVGFEKLFIVKDLVHFMDLVMKSETECYGSSTEINHGIQNFSKESRKWVEFVQSSVEEQQRLISSVEHLTWKSYSRKFQELELYGWRIDRLFELIEKSSIAFENRDTKTKKTLTSCVKDPKLVMNIYPLTEKNTFWGVTATMAVPRMYAGSGRLYYFDLDNGYLCRTTEDFYECMGSMLTDATDHNLDVLRLDIGRNKMADFYYGVLPELSEYVDIIDHQPELIDKYLVPETVFSFYLDAEDGDVDCKVMAEYGERKVSCLDLRRSDVIIENYRMQSKEQEVLLHLDRIFPEYDLETDRFYCGGDEERIFGVISSGIEELTKLGNVFCTNRFKNIRKMRTPTVSVGVNVSSGMLELDLMTQDLSKEELLEILKNYKRQQRYYRLKSGEYIELMESSLQLLFEMMESMHVSPRDFVKGKMHLPLYRMLYLDKMLEEHSEVYNTRDQAFKTLIKNMKSVKEADFEVPATLDRIMRNYQKNGFRWMKTLEECGFGGILADDMGLGKTLQTIAVLLSARQENKEGTSLIVCPASLVYNWLAEFEKFAPELRVLVLAGKAEERAQLLEQYEQADVLVTSYDILKRDIDQYEGKAFLYEIIDEAQSIKNHITAASKAVKLIGSKVRFALTGTPIENRLSELWSIFDYLMPGFLYSYETFRKEFETQIVKHEDEKKREQLQKMVQPFILRRMKKDVLKDLPDKLEENRIVHFDEEQKRLYDAQVLQMKDRLAAESEEDFKKNRFEVLAELTRLRQLCCDPHLCYENYRGTSAKLESCMELIESAMEGGHKMLLFSQFTSMLTIIEQALQDRKIAYYKITGETSKQERLSRVKKFNEDETPVFLISLKAGGVGLNLTGADVVIHYDPWWNVAVQNQATDRAHRIGQTRKVTVYKMIVKGSVEEKIVKLQQTKKDLADQILSGENTGIQLMSKDDLMELLGIE